MLSVAEIQSGTAGLRATQLRFLEAVVDTGSLTDAAKACGITRQSAYDWMQAEGYKVDTLSDAPVGTFSCALLQAKQMAAEHALGTLHRIQQGDGMPAAVSAMFTVKRWYPEYRDQLNVRHSGAVLNARINLNELDATERTELLSLVQRRLLLSQAEGDVALPDPTEDVGGG